ncbi:sigma-54-dependent Fis family transcriptional regulator [Alloalcanivorax profundimaris]|uniref:sigma-54-dependent Fis family transcriptional regulator n=1 Tax=Alloalcanivorax profundimaris TaxID=2735259 RepID=UPI00188775F1|nr:sigma-54-dependent Fis family transcriptional regulator [Alloalcanivorax profundimaris]MBF1802913.1 sigma-54-dependent Fis family transcriptional regulator [Alloalcanivorax profundimaris]MCQ6262074.1 sigma-54-dependent Fis family transcriptional regulator [Alcanivorax sp. MM125-6]
MSALEQQQRHHIDRVLRYADGHPRPDNPIGRSWKRCIEEYGLDPASPRPARIVTHRILREHQESADEFLNVARAGVEQLYGQIARLGYVLLLTDQRGITVQFLGDRRHDRRLRQAGLYLGADWNEHHAGTCAVGTCIREGRALTCHRQDHFDATHIGLTCTSAPITDPQGRLLAVLDISALGTTLFGTLIEPRRPPRPRAADDGERVPALDRLAADDPAMRRTLGLAKRLRHRDVSLLILGETGTGKEVLARAIHDTGGRQARPFVAVNCAAIPESLIESELFGYRPGTFTGARAKGARGLIQLAHGGTLFLDEIGDMPLALQTRLLRVLAEGEVLPLGAEQPVKVDCRVIAATHRDPARLIAEGRFREDLYYRLNGATLRLPPLRERADKQHVIAVTLAELGRHLGRPAPRLRADAMSALLACPWPGNVRQLANALTFAEATRDGEEITVADLPEECLERVIGPAAAPVDSGDPARDELERLLKRHQWRISPVARHLGVSRPTVYRRMRRHRLTPPNQRDGEAGGEAATSPPTGRWGS